MSNEHDEYPKAFFAKILELDAWKSIVEAKFEAGVNMQRATANKVIYLVLREWNHTWKEEIFTPLFKPYWLQV